MALSETILCITAIMVIHLAWSETATISRPFHNDIYPSLPSEVLQVKPILVYPRPRGFKLFKSQKEQQEEDKVIYVKLLKVNYRPKQKKLLEELEAASKGSKSKNNIFYVKALANGQFSDHRLKHFRVPEFYAINVYKKNEVI